jgi:hypothetical protein
MDRGGALKLNEDKMNKPKEPSVKIVKELGITILPMIIVLVILLTALILSLTTPVQAAVLYSYSGPDVSDDLLELSDFEVIGPEPQKAGDTLTVVFTLRSVEVPIKFGKHGVFVAARDPDGMNRDFGHVYQNGTLEEDESINFEATITVDKEGEWIFWSAYYIKENLDYSPYYYEHFGPDRWHACYLDIVSAAQPDLIVEEIFWNPSRPKIEEQVTVGVIVKNTGNALSGENDLILWGCCDLTSRVPALEPGEKTTIYFEDSPLIFGETGVFEIVATIDDANEISESNEENNERSEFIEIETMPILSVLISINPVPSGESDEITVQVAMDGNRVDGAHVYLSSTIGKLDPIEGVTDEDGEFVSIFTAPTVETTETYTIYAEAEIENRRGEGSVSDLITVTPPPNIPPTVPLAWILAVIVLVIAAVPIIRKAIERVREENGKNKKGSIYMDSNPKNALIYLDNVYSGLSTANILEVPVGTHDVKFRKFGYFDCEREVIVNAYQTTTVYCDLTEMPEIKLKLSADPDEIPADEKSKSTITIEIEDKNGILIPVPEEMTVVLETNIGSVESPVKIPAGRASTTATLISSKSSGTAIVRAELGKILKDHIAVEFLEVESR